MVFTASIRAEELVHFSIDKKVYENLSNSQQTNLSQKAGELTRFVESTLLQKIPAPIREKISDLKITVQLTDEPGRDGLFIPQESHEQKILVQLNQIYSNGIKALLAHEIFHVIHFYLNPDEMPWMREGMAQLFEFITTDELNGMNVSAAVANPMTPLLGDYDINQTSRAQYGHDLLYFYYLYSQCGKDTLFWNLVTGVKENKLFGSYLIDEVLSRTNSTKIQCTNFEESAISFEAAKVHNQLQYYVKPEMERFFIYYLDIKPNQMKFSTKESLNQYIDSMPSLSSMKYPLVEFKKLEGQCNNCEFFYAQKSFPYTVSNKITGKEEGLDVILVKLLKE